MKMLIKQRFFSWLDSYTVSAEDGSTLYTVEGQLSWGHCLKVYDAAGQELGMVRERMLVLLPKYEIYLHGQYRGCVCKLLSLRPRYSIDYLGWQVAGDLLELDYRISDAAGRPIASVAKEPLRLTDTYVIHVPRSENALAVLMFVLAMDAERCSRGK